MHKRTQRRTAFLYIFFICLASLFFAIVLRQLENLKYATPTVEYTSTLPTVPKPPEKPTKTLGLIKPDHCYDIRPAPSCALYDAVDSKEPELCNQIDTSWGRLGCKTMVSEALALEAQEEAKEAITQISDEILQRLQEERFSDLSTYIHPEKGVRLSPHGHVLSEHIVIPSDKIGTLSDEEEILTWGVYDGTGEEIQMSKFEYYNTFLYDIDFIEAPNISFNRTLGKGNLLNNAYIFYNNPYIAEYHFPGLHPSYAGMDWRSLRLVFEEFEGNWKLVGIIHDQWTT